MKTTIKGVEIELTPEQIAKTEAAKKLTPEQHFLEMMDGCTIRIDQGKYPGSIFFMKDGRYMFEITKYGQLWCDWGRVWGIFEKEYDMCDDEIQSFLKNQVEEHFKMRGVTPLAFCYIPSDLVEEHFKSSTK